MARTVAEHVLLRLKRLGITGVFGVPGDFSFGISDAVMHDPELRGETFCPTRSRPSETS